MDASLRSRAEQLASEFSSQATTAEELNSFMRLMMKSALERMLNTELDVHLGRKGMARVTAAEQQSGEAPAAAEPSVPPAAAGKRSPNRRNGHSQKTVSGDLGELTLDTPRDRAGTFQPQLIGKHQRRVPGFDEKILALYAIESVNSVIRKFTRNRKIYPNEESALKIVYMAIHEAAKKWTMPIRQWKQALNHFAILFEGRMPQEGN